MLDIIIIIIMITNAFVCARLSRADKMDLCFEINDDTSLCRITHGTGWLLARSFVGCPECLRKRVRSRDRSSHPGCSSALCSPRGFVALVVSKLLIN